MCKLFTVPDRLIDALVLASSAIVMAVSSLIPIVNPKSNFRGRAPGASNINRVRKDLSSYFAELVPSVFRRHYRIVHPSDWMISVSARESFTAVGKRSLA